MAKQTKFIPVKTDSGWQLNVPAKYSETGKRQRLYFLTKAKAEGKAALLAAGREKHGTGLRHLDPVKQHQAEDAFEILSREGISTPLTEIVLDYIDRRKKTLASKPFVEVFDLFVRSKTRRPAYKTALDALREISRPLHPQIIRDITPQEIDDLLTDMGPAHRNQRLRELRAVFNYGIKKLWAEKNPVHSLDKSEHYVAEPEIYEPGELGKLLATAATTNRKLIPLFVLGAFAGIRQNEILRLDWRNIDIAERSIDLEASQTKRNRRRSADINDTLLAWLQWYIEKYGIQRGPVSAWSGIWSVRVPVRKLHKDAEVPAKANGLRHSFASYHLAEHNKIDDLVLALGHQGNSSVLWKHYHRSVKKSAAALYWALTPQRVLEENAIQISAAA